jgi:hypothetical protein
MTSTGTEWTIAYRKPKANRFVRKDLHLTWKAAHDLAGDWADAHPGLQVFYVCNRQAELDGYVGQEDIRNILMESGKRIRIYEEIPSEAIPAPSASIPASDPASIPASDPASIPPPVSYRKMADLTVIPAMIYYEVTRDGDVIGYVRPSRNGPGWAYTLDLDSAWTWVQHSSRKIAADHLLSAYRPMASWLS